MVTSHDYQYQQKKLTLKISALCGMVWYIMVSSSYLFSFVAPVPLQVQNLFNMSREAAPGKCAFLQRILICKILSSP